MNSTFNDSLLMQMWSLTALVITASFSGGILNKIITPDTYSINTFEEMIGSGLKIYTYNSSWVWYEFRDYQKGYTEKLDKKFSLLKSRINFITNDEIIDKVK